MTDISGPLLLATAVFLPELLRRLDVSNTVIRFLAALIAVASIAMLVNMFAVGPFKIELSEPYGFSIEISLWILVLIGSVWQMIPRRSPTSKPKTG